MHRLWCYHGVKSTALLKAGIAGWQAGEELDATAVAGMKRFLATSTPRVRAFGGARFDAGRLPAPEWAEFGAYTFVLPR